MFSLGIFKNDYMRRRLKRLRLIIMPTETISLNVSLLNYACFTVIGTFKEMSYDNVYL